MTASGPPELALTRTPPQGDCGVSSGRGMMFEVEGVGGTDCICVVVGHAKDERNGVVGEKDGSRGTSGYEDGSL